jgi:hypothetical protein
VLDPDDVERIVAQPRGGRGLAEHVLDHGGEPRAAGQLDGGLVQHVAGLHGDDAGPVSRCQEPGAASEARAQIQHPLPGDDPGPRGEPLRGREGAGVHLVPGRQALDVGPVEAGIPAGQIVDDGAHVVAADPVLADSPIDFVRCASHGRGRSLAAMVIAHSIP